MLAIDVFAHAIAFMKKHIEKNLCDSLSKQFAEEVYYVITCPAIWREQAKLFMRTAAKFVRI